MTIQQMKENAKNALINTMREAIRQMFTTETHTMKACMLAMDCANELHDEYEMTWAEIEAFQII